VSFLFFSFGFCAAQRARHDVRASNAASAGVRSPSNRRDAVSLTSPPNASSATAKYPSPYSGKSSFNSRSFAASASSGGGAEVSSSSSSIVLFSAASSSAKSASRPRSTASRTASAGSASPFGMPSIDDDDDDDEDGF